MARRLAWYGGGLVLLTMLAIGGTSCGTTPHAPSAGVRRTAPASPPTSTTTTSTTLATTTTSTTLATTRTTARWRPTAPAPTQELAVYDAVEAWYLNERAKALAVASPSVVAVLFSHAFPEGAVQYTGCSATPGPTPADYCTYRWGTQEKILELTTTQVRGGWAVTSTFLLS